MKEHAISGEGGFALLEALLAILIFSIGILAAVGMQAVAIKQSTDARYRTEAALLANKLIGTMWVSDRTTSNLQNLYGTAACNSTGKTGYTAWLAEVISGLPGVAAGTQTAPTVCVSDQGLVTVTVYWRTPTQEATERHRYIAVAQIR